MESKQRPVRNIGYQGEQMAILLMAKIVRKYEQLDNFAVRKAGKLVGV